MYQNNKTSVRRSSRIAKQQTFVNQIPHNSSFCALTVPLLSHSKSYLQPFCSSNDDVLISAPLYDGSSNKIRYRKRGYDEYIQLNEWSAGPKLVRRHDNSFKTTSTSNGYRLNTNYATQASLKELPDALVAKCFFGGYIDSTTIVSILSMVSTRVTEIAKESVKVLDLRRCEHLKCTDVGVLVRRYQNLSHLDFRNCEQFSNAHIEKLLPITRTLRILRLQGCSVSDEGIKKYFNKACQFKYCSKGSSMLEYFDLACTKKKNSILLGDTSVEVIAESCPYLNTLSLSWCSNVSDKSIYALKKLTYLSDIDLSLTSITSKACSILSTFKALRKLKMDATSVKGNGLSELVTGGPKAGRSYECKLTSLSLQFLKDISYKTVGELVSCCHDLGELNLSYCENLDFKSYYMEHLLVKCTKRNIVLTRDGYIV